MKYLITGGCGFLGSNIASRLIKNDEVILFDILSRVGSSENLSWLRGLSKSFKFIHGDIRVQSDCEELIALEKPDIVFHLAGQVAMTTSLARPRFDFEVNTFGTLNILEAIRLGSPKTGMIFSSTNKVYGDLEYLNYKESPTRYTPADFPFGLPSNLALDFHSPYGCSKGSADQYVLDYSRMYGIKTVVFRHSSMFGGRQFFTSDQGWIGWFCSQAIRASKGISKEFTVSGNGKQVRDLLYADDMIKLYLKAASRIELLNGRAFNIGGGIDNSFSVIELLKELEVMVDHELRWQNIDWRDSDQKFFVADIEEISNLLDWTPKIHKKEGLKRMLDWVERLNEN